MAVSHFSPQFQISARAETSHVIATKFQPGGRAEISARAETRHVIGPLESKLGHQITLYKILTLVACSVTVNQLRSTKNNNRGDYLFKLSNI